ncbi:TPR Domain containing protein [Trichomonas vaginalis G3]|uniref:TPR Domain containing protein n=1 Tax=Trichomonas vaginalis (strain ATCC PRA-98 / G3) TaxID=412133 RepID=A2FB57_TRIV3|nr:suppressor of RPS4-RLD 1 family [Trichomonas vaginalis G3]EAX97838.1 TPR Domain containing protein [Trichomonas vaginalis G3]KAI5541810.1 suppressor of RPS4-RLD 1 family [Trichomonas vaginalis G3]|eukprot:XP_001310768.1 TPR Domain containing protein [Trichomonas vaginalis G3]
MSTLEILHDGNNAFYAKKYTLAYKLYDYVMKNSKNEREKLIAQANLAILQEEINMNEAGDDTYPMNVDTSMIGIWPKRKTYIPDERTPIEEESSQGENEITYEPGLKVLSKATEIIENQKSKSYPYSQRGDIFTMMGLYKNATNDLRKALDLDASQSLLLKLVNSSLFSNDLDTYSFIIHNFDDNSCFGALSQGLLLWSSRRFDEALKYINKAIENEEENALLMRARLYFVLGQINNSYNDWLQSGYASDDIVFVLKFLRDTAIPPEPKDDTWKSYSLRHFRAGIYKSLFYERMITVPLDLWIPLQVQSEWASGGMLRYPPVPLCQSEQSYPEGFALGLSESQRAAAKALLRTAYRIGASTSSRECSPRAFKCVGMAVLELSEEIRSSPVSFSQAAAIPAHWLRLLDPMQPLFMRCSLRDCPIVLHVQRDLFLSDLIIFQPTLLSIVKKNLLESCKDIIAQKISLAKTADDIWDIVRSDVSVRIGSSDSEIYIRKMPAGHIEFGIVIPSGQSHLDELAKAEVSWSALMNTLARGPKVECLEHLMRFLYHWMRSCPLTAQSHTVGMIIFHAIIVVILKRAAFDLPPPIHVLIEAILANDFPEFKETLTSHMKASLIDEHITEIPSIRENLPNFPSRIAALIIDDAKKEESK